MRISSVLRRVGRGILCVVALAVIGLALSGTRVSAGEIKWTASFDKAFQAAQEKKMPVMIDVYTDWCGWCKKLDKDVYTANGVVELSKKFICLKLNPDKDKAHGELFKVEGYPTIIFTSADQKELHRVVGYRPAQGFQQEMKKALDAFSAQK